jgi:hypothetical protein
MGIVLLLPLRVVDSIRIDENIHSIYEMRTALLLLTKQKTGDMSKKR